MATFWLDAARFADTNGLQNDFRRSMWLWRDWVINAYNNNMPFDQFTIEQLAGDMLPAATLEQKIASGFNRNHRSNTEGGSINEEWLVENVVDRVETTSTVFLGLTMGCARCHDHKFDPISQREFYQFFSYFNNVDERGVYNEHRGNAGPTVSVPTEELKSRISAIEDKIADETSRLNELESGFKKKQNVWEAWLASGESNTFNSAAVSRDFLGSEDHLVPESGPLVDVMKEAVKTHKFSKEAIGYVVDIQPGKNQHLNFGELYDFDSTKGFTVSVWVRPTQYGAIISKMDVANSHRGFDMLITPDGRLNVHLIHDWPGNATKITTLQKIPINVWTHVLVSVAATGKASDISVFFNGHKGPTTTEADSLTGSTTTDHPLWLGLRESTPPFNGKITALRVLDETTTNSSAQKFYYETMNRFVTNIHKMTAPSRELKNEIEHHFRQSHDLYRPALDELNRLKKELEATRKQMPTTMVMKELVEPRQTYVLTRGLYDQPDNQQPVSAGVPSIFRPDADSKAQPANRLELARWLVDGNNPLTARVAVNHFWARIFGIGLLETPENFGVQSPPASHPELLDWLATEFVRTGWNIKQIQRLLVTSATYRQSSNAATDSFVSDPKNRMLSRGARFRMPAESIRDNALAISGLLTDQVGGPSIKPYQPEGLWAELAGGAGEPPYKQAVGEELYRRSLYIYRKRTVPHPTMTTFDGVGRDICSVARDRTNTPLQALALLNDTTYVEAAIHLAVRAIDHQSDEAQRLSFAFYCATCRRPEKRELNVLHAALKKYILRFSDSPESAKSLVNVGQSKPSAKYDPLELAAYASVCSVILNLDEVISRE